VDRPLAGIRVLEVDGGIAGSTAGMLLADLGAHVWKVAAADTSVIPPDRRIGSLRWDRNKQIVDTSAGGIAAAAATALAQMGAAPDLVIDCTPDRSLHGALRTQLANSVWLRVVPGDESVPWPDGRESAELLTATSGLSEVQSRAEEGPIDFATPHTLYLHGLWAASCGVSALIARDQTGTAQDVVVDGLDAATLIAVASFALAEGAVDQPAFTKGPGGANPFYTRYRCRDGSWVFLGALFPRFRERALQALGLDMELMYAVFEEWEWWVVSPDTLRVRAALAEAFASNDRDHWMRIMEELDCPHGPLLHREHWLDHEQIRAIGGREEFEHPEFGRVVTPSVPIGFRSIPAPTGDRVPSISRTAGGPGPLGGVKVLDLGTVLAGPIAGCMLSFLGADVLKVEPLEGDGYRVSGFGFNRGMRSITVDLKQQRGREALLRLTDTADVFIENYRPGVLDRLGVGHDVLRARRPDLVTVALSGFGDTGPLALKQGFDPILQSMSGIMHAQGGDDEPVFLTTAVNDVCSGVGAVLGTVAGLFARGRTGSGAAVSSSLALMSTFLQSGELIQCAGRTAARPGGGNFAGPGPLDRYYRAADAWVRVQARSDVRGALVSGGFLPAEVLQADDAGVVRAMAARCSSLPAASLVEELQRHGVQAVVARSPRQVIFAPTSEMGDRFGFCGEVGGGRYHGAQRWARFSASGTRGALFAPGLGEHTEAILAEVGYTADEIGALIADNVVSVGPPLS